MIIDIIDGFLIQHDPIASWTVSGLKVRTAMAAMVCVDFGRDWDLFATCCNAGRWWKVPAGISSDKHCFSPVLMSSD